MTNSVKDGRIPADALKKFCIDALGRVGVPNDHALIVAESLVLANLRGVDSHGVGLLPRYVRRIKVGLMNPRVIPKIVRDFGSIAVIDGENGIGQVITTKAMEISIAKAKNFGMGTAGIRNSNHFGIAAYYAIQAIQSDMIGIVLSNAAPSMAPWGGTKPLIGTNPLAIGIPTDNNPIILDMAISVQARGKIRQAALEEKSIPEGWALDERGKPTTDPKEALKGSLLPIAGPKGYGLALIVDVLSGVLTGSFFSDKISSVHEEEEGTPRVGHFVQAINIESFMPMKEFKNRINELIQKIRESPFAEGVNKIYLPGEIESDRHKERLESGIPLSEAGRQQLIGLAKELGMKSEL
jgi:LDH2 family malate/lactate/ureidoglycolate dehydrogenase